MGETRFYFSLNSDVFLNNNSFFVICRLNQSNYHEESDFSSINRS